MGAGFLQVGARVAGPFSPEVRSIEPLTPFESDRFAFSHADPPPGRQFRFASRPACQGRWESCRCVHSNCCSFGFTPVGGSGLPRGRRVDENILATADRSRSVAAVPEKEAAW